MHIRFTMSCFSYKICNGNCSRWTTPRRRLEVNPPSIERFEAHLRYLNHHHPEAPKGLLPQLLVAQVQVQVMSKMAFHSGEIYSFNCMSS